MIRAIVGTVAVLAGFAVVETSVDASTGFAGSCKASDAHILLHAGETLAVRSAPTPGGSVLGTLEAQKGAEGLAVVTLTGSRSGWARIALNSKEYSAADGSVARFGWIPADLLLVNSASEGRTTLLNNPGLLGSEIGQIEGAKAFRVLGCRGEFLHVINAEQGNVWIDRWSAKAG
jgi:hypothetical protein